MDRKPLSELEEKRLPQFDADYSPQSHQNVAAAEARGLTYDHRSQVYRDEDGCIVRDRYGQEL